MFAFRFCDGALITSTVANSQLTTSVVFDDGFILFDSHARNEDGKADGNGGASLYKFTSVDDLVNYFLEVYYGEYLDVTFFKADLLMCGETIERNHEVRKEWILPFKIKGDNIQWENV